MHQEILNKLKQSDFPRRFHLKEKDKEYIATKGLAVIKTHAKDFISKRLAPANIPNDGKQTPMHGHPVFIAQHATACCCRECLSKWHKIALGHQLSITEQEYVINLIMEWIKTEL